MALTSSSMLTAPSPLPSIATQAEMSAAPSAMLTPITSSPMLTCPSASQSGQVADTGALPTTLTRATKASHLDGAATEEPRRWEHGSSARWTSRCGWCGLRRRRTRTVAPARRRRRRSAALHVGRLRVRRSYFASMPAPRRSVGGAPTRVNPVSARPRSARPAPSPVAAQPLDRQQRQHHQGGVGLPGGAVAAGEVEDRGGEVVGRPSSRSCRTPSRRPSGGRSGRRRRARREPAPAARRRRC